MIREKQSAKWLDAMFCLLKVPPREVEKEKEVGK